MVHERRRLLLSEMELQCGFALKAYGNAAVALEGRDAEGFWYSLQALLSAAAHLRAFLESDRELGTTLGVPAGSPLRRPELASVADVRGALLRWSSSRPRGPLRVSNFGPAGLTTADPAMFARFIDVDASVAVLFGDAHDLAALLAAVAQLHDVVKAELRHMQEVV
jgi:hypothetical protein